MQYEKNGDGTRITFKILELMITLGVILGSIIIWSLTQAANINRNSENIEDTQQDMAGLQENIKEINNTINNEIYGLKVLNNKIENLTRQISR